jgi:catechol 2,3-dioxygenase-like lactoylglutathione lyase family enzyme
MSNSFVGVAVDCNDAAALARFWGAVLGRPVAEDATRDSAVLLAGDEAGSGPRLTFHRVPEAKVVKNRLHLDLISDTFDAETERLLSLGARTLRELENGKSRWMTFADIEGNEFDLIAG